MNPRLYLLFIFLSLSFTFCNQRSNGQKPFEMKLWTIKNADIEKVISNITTQEDIINLVDSLDWNIFHQVILEQKSGDALEVGGSYEDGFSSSLTIAYEEFIIDQAPETPKELRQILVSYLEDADLVMEKYKFY